MISNKKHKAVIDKAFIKALLILTLKFGVALGIITVAFAVIYTSLPKAFFHANPMKDPAYYELKEKVLNDICGAILEKPAINVSTNFCIQTVSGSTIYPVTTIYGQYDQAELKAISLQLGNVEGNFLHLNINYHVQLQSNIQKNLGPTGGSGDSLRLDLGTITEFTPEFSLEITDADSVFKMNPPIEQLSSGSYTEFFNKNTLLPFRNTKFYQNRLGSFVAFTASATNLYNLREYLNNVPLKEPSFWKMVYFSVITFASFGFGDIVPISYLARITVVFEIIFGIFFYGFFISALYDCFKRRDNPEQRLKKSRRHTGYYLLKVASARKYRTKKFN